MVWFVAVFFLLIAVAMFLRRAELSHLQAMILGGSVAPGCVIAEAVVIAVLALIIVLAHSNGIL